LAAVNTPSFGSISVETASSNATIATPESGIHWLPIVRD
jgi:hypothetical protein